MTSPDDRVLFDVDSEKRIATITLNRPDKHNSFSPTLIDEMQNLEPPREGDGIETLETLQPDGRRMLRGGSFAAGSPR